MQKVKNKWIKIGSEVLILASLFTLVQYLITAGLLNQYYQINLTSMCINVILAVSLSLINGFTGQLSLGHAGFMAVGAYVSVIITNMLDLPQGKPEDQRAKTHPPGPDHRRR
jgi:branched-chain amino acid transport system permease protein